MADRAGFEILWRETTEARWSVLTFTEKSGETVLTNVSTDNHYFAVRAVVVAAQCDTVSCLELNSRRF